ncbi:endo alpha-1,4 polygalactosaminidase [Solicola gregarius]|uniref:Endo alpha-1,4 polygalactosaminidase n=1 Tax=Solicola gregarius TaxID=2908642 RepID=A0AA46TED1_9ACTN|nr:endo alpha-1,4 polygalactosaminidase [Solicola gregarius]UYM03804.1 endo alpha-1,4 polygalactosaminidase [Solicola gregarius]
MLRSVVPPLAALLAFSLVSPATAGVHKPPVNGRADYQLGGAYRPAKGVDIVTRDRSALPAKGRYNICYVNSFQTQPGSLRWWKRHHPRLLLRNRRGQLVHDPGWPGEVLLDTSATSKRRAIARAQKRWYAGCARTGFDAVEPDNLDSWTRSRRLLTRRDNVALARRLTRLAHHNGLAIAQKNTPQLSRRQSRRVGFDFAVAEECEVYRECGRYTRTYGRRVIEIEYTDNGRRAFKRACRKRGGRISVLLRDRDVVPRGNPAYRYRWC